VRLHYESNLVECVFNYLCEWLKVDKVLETPVFSVVHLIPGVNKLGLREIT